MASIIAETWCGRADRGVEQRLAVLDRSPMIPLSSLKKDPHLEMHTRGG